MWESNSRKSLAEMSGRLKGCSTDDPSCEDGPTVKDRISLKSPYCLISSSRYSLKYTPSTFPRTFRASAVLSRTDGHHARGAPGFRLQTRTCRPWFWRSCSLWGESKPRQRQQAACRASQSRPDLSSVTSSGLAEIGPRLSLKPTLST